MYWRWLRVAALALFAFWSALLIAQKPGLYYDEALLSAGGVVLNHPELLPALPKHPSTWTCVGETCFPLMAEDKYIGGIKEYLCAPLFAMFGPRPSIIRLVSLLLALVGIWGISKLLADHASPALGAAVALVLAIHPSYLTMNIFDNGAVAAMMAGLGLCCAALSCYLLRPSMRTAFFVGAAVGFAIWTRANFIWTLVAALLALILVFRRQVIPPWRHLAIAALGGIAGGFPFLWYQIISGAGTWGAVDRFRIDTSWSSLLAARSFELREVLVADGEHRIMWKSWPIPSWQLWLLPLIAAVASGIGILFGRKRNERWPVAQAVCSWALILAVLLCVSRLTLTEHHLIAVLPLAAAASVLGCAVIQQRLRRGWMVTAALAATYGACALYWDVHSVLGLRATGGTAQWSDAIYSLTSELQVTGAGRTVKILDWGFYEGLFVLSGGGIQGIEVAATETPARSYRGFLWRDEIREGGLFLVSGPGNRSFPAPVSEFLKALSEANPVIEWQKTILERSGETYAQLLDIRPDSLGQGTRKSEISKIEMQDPASEALLTGFYPAEAQGWRWTRRRFSATVQEPGSLGGAPWMLLDGYVSEVSIQKLGKLTLSAKVGPNPLGTATYSQPGTFVFSQRLKPEWFKDGKATVEFELDQALPPSGQESRELGVIVRSITVESK